jgi:hypothetical protein
MALTMNLNSKNCLLQISRNLTMFLNENQFSETVSLKENQKLDKECFVKYFNVTIVYIMITDYNYCKGFSKS